VCCGEYPSTEGQPDYHRKAPTLSPEHVLRVLHFVTKLHRAVTTADFGVGYDTCQYTDNDMQPMNRYTR
jgi:hypothetical protein